MKLLVRWMLFLSRLAPLPHLPSALDAVAEPVLPLSPVSPFPAHSMLFQAHPATVCHDAALGPLCAFGACICLVASSLFVLNEVTKQDGNSRPYVVCK